MTSRHRMTGVALLAVLHTACSTAATYSPPPERRAAERCPSNETWVCTDRYPSRLEKQNDPPMFCRCENIHRLH
jgi:hypothetical protein